MKRFVLNGNEHQINVIIVRSDQDVRAEQDPKPKTHKPRRRKVHRVLIKKEAPEVPGPSYKDPPPVEEEDNDFDLPSPSDLFRIGQEIGQEIGPQG
jgi:hypothetical protein